MTLKIASCLLALASLLPRAAQASEIVWLELSGHLKYEDFSVSCYADYAWTQSFFSAETNDGRVVAARLKAWKSPAASTIAFTSEEAADIETYRDKTGRLWIREVRLSPRLFYWIVRNLDGHGGSSCRPPVPLVALDPSPVRLEFETDGIDDGIRRSYSNGVFFSGKRYDGHPYRGYLRLMQREPWY